MLLSRSPSTSSQRKPWFTDPDGDIYIITSDEIKFRVSRDKLAQQSDIFRDMFALVPSKEVGTVPIDGTEKDPIKIEEKAQIFDYLLRHIYQSDLLDLKHPDNFLLDTPFKSILASQKYFMPNVTRSLVNELKNSSEMKTSPGRVYAFACIHDLPDLASHALAETYHHGILQIYLGPEGDSLSAGHYQRLIEAHRERTVKAVKQVVKFEKEANYYQETTIGRRAKHSAKYSQCNCNRESDRLPRWFTHFCMFAKMELRKAPSSENIFGGNAVLTVLKSVDCHDCVTNMHENWDKLQELKYNIDRMSPPSSIYDGWGSPPGGWGSPF